MDGKEFIRVPTCLVESLPMAGFTASDTGTKLMGRDFPGGAVVKNSPASAGDTGSSPGPGRSHMPQSN